MDKFEELLSRLDRLISVVEKEKVRLEIKETEKTNLRLAIKDKKDINVVLVQVTELFKSLGGEQQSELLEKLEKFVSFGLYSVFGQEYNFVTLVGAEGKDLKVDFFIQMRGMNMDVTEAKGGGVAQVVSMLLQLFFVVVLKGTLAPFLLLDTAMVHLSEKYHQNMSALLKELCERMDIQVVLLAHAGDFGAYADALYEFKQRDGKTIAERLK